MLAAVQHLLRQRDGRREVRAVFAVLAWKRIMAPAARQGNGRVPDEREQLRRVARAAIEDWLEAGGMR